MLVISVTRINSLRLLIDESAVGLHGAADAGEKRGIQCFQESIGIRGISFAVRACVQYYKKGWKDNTDIFDVSVPW